ncbi:MAG TPA: hypothetical protein VER96_10420 [Polyangiaceae bacterium]|nr:hypothetical protein [Polyangiaceae bacterium]
MATAAGKYVGALLLACAGLVFSSCAPDKQPEAQAEQLAEEATQRVCDIFETCCVAANFPYREEGCKAIYGPKIRNHFVAQAFLGSDLDSVAAKRCLDAIGQVSDGCRADRDRYLTDACDGLFHGTVPLGGECDPRHGCATTPDAPLTCLRHYEEDSGYDYSGVCVAGEPRFLHKRLGQSCSQTCAAEGGVCVREGIAGEPEPVEGTCFASDGLFCDMESWRCEQQSVSGGPCENPFQCAAGTYCDSAAKCVPVRALGEACADSAQCAGDFCNSAGICQGSGPSASAKLCEGHPATMPSGPPLQATGGQASH